jgi:hypothetical protein
MRAAVAIKPTAVDIVAEFDTVTTRKDYGKALAAIGDSGRFSR